jgi:hypothetical protein
MAMKRGRFSEEQIVGILKESRKIEEAAVTEKRWPSSERPRMGNRYAIQGWRRWMSRAAVR